MTRPTICLWFDGKAEEAARFYEAAIPGARVVAVRRSPVDYPAGKAGDVLTVEFAIGDTAFVALNGGPGTPFTNALSIQLDTADQAETDRIWDALLADGGEPVACSWLKDRYGLSWQIVPRRLMEGMSHPDPAVAARVMAAMMTMVKIDVAAIDRAIAGEG
jgi:2-polyprenyl-6-hydroxyphenyl methylase/3-demethylubiquinone-9 3-methyltransferase